MRPTAAVFCASRGPEQPVVIENETGRYVYLQVPIRPEADRPTLGAPIDMRSSDELGDASRFIRVDHGVAQASLELNAAVS
jgi:hypothetical protein